MNGDAMKTEKEICQDCGREVDEVCGDGYCRNCHVSLSFEDCVDGTWVAKRMMAMAKEIGDGAEGRTKKMLKEIYPGARI